MCLFCWMTTTAIAAGTVSSAGLFGIVAFKIRAWRRR